jgi:hypothetical protein
MGADDGGDFNTFFSKAQQFLFQSLPPEKLMFNFNTSGFTTSTQNLVLNKLKTTKYSQSGRPLSRAG